MTSCSSPAYIAVLANPDAQAVAVDDAWHDPRTRALHDYLESLGLLAAG